MTTYFLGLEVPAGARRRLEETMSLLGDEHPLPHVTVIAPPRLGNALEWLEPVRVAVAEFPRFVANLGTARTFGDRVLYLTVESTPLVQLHRHLLAVLGPTNDDEEAHEGPSYVAHLTLAVARGRRSLPPYEPALAQLGSFRPFAVRSVVVFAREVGDVQYRAWRRLPLSSTAAA